MAFELGEFFTINSFSHNLSAFRSLLLDRNKVGFSSNLVHIFSISLESHSVLDVDNIRFPLQDLVKLTFNAVHVVPDTHFEVLQLLDDVLLTVIQSLLNFFEIAFGTQSSHDLSFSL